MEKQELIRYRVFADALIRLNGAARTLLQEGADAEALKMILSGTAKLFAELEERMARALPELEDRPVDLRFEEGSTSPLPIESKPRPTEDPQARPTPPPPTREGDDSSTETSR
jgi:hypothetical protein